LRSTVIYQLIGGGRDSADLGHTINGLAFVLIANAPNEDFAK